MINIALLAADPVFPRYHFVLSEQVDVQLRHWTSNIWLWPRWHICKRYGAFPWHLQLHVSTRLTVVNVSSAQICTVPWLGLRSHRTCLAVSNHSLKQLHTPQRKKLLLRHSNGWPQDILAPHNRSLCTRLDTSRPLRSSTTPSHLSRVYTSARSNHCTLKGQTMA